ncbi:hypothetical protein LIER_10184 [Lithospermum erythrorhizon]|uniref:CCHC-type domain-containing protein n=1 Tax=Lithospermum erythrorhizon TaxID=34254 RepID=A0AAV3PKP3_LITER
MDAAIIKSLLKCNLNGNELKPIRLEVEDLAEGIIECELSVYAKVLTLKKSFVSGPILHIFFPTFAVKKRVVDSGPWCFNSQLLVMKDWIRGEDPLDFRFDECTFWIHVRVLNSKFFTWDVASKLANSFPACEEFQLDEEVVTSYLAYKRLPHPCFKCGRLGHLICQCPELREGADPKKEYVYDMWIKAPMEKSWVVFKLNDETEDCLPLRLGEQLSEQPSFSTRMVRGERTWETNQ